MLALVMNGGGGVNVLHWRYKKRIEKNKTKFYKYNGKNIMDWYDYSFMYSYKNMLFK